MSVSVAVCGPDGTAVGQQAFSDDRTAVRRATVLAALDLLTRTTRNLRADPRMAGYRGPTTEEPRADKEAL